MATIQSTTYTLNLDLLCKSIALSYSYRRVFYLADSLMSLKSALYFPSYAACEQRHFGVAEILLENEYPVHEEHSWILLDPPPALNVNNVSGMTVELSY